MNPLKLGFYLDNGYFIYVNFLSLKILIFARIIFEDSVDLYLTIPTFHECNFQICFYNLVTVLAPHISMEFFLICITLNEQTAWRSAV